MINKQKILNILAILFFVFIFLNDTTVYNVYFESISSVFVLCACIILLMFIFLTRKIYVYGKFWLFMLFWLITIIISCSLAGLTKFFFVRLAYWSITVIMVSTMYIAKVNLRKTIYNVSKIFCVWCLICYFYTCMNFNFLPITHTSDKLAYNFYTIDLYGFFVSKPISHLSLFNTVSFLRLDRPFGEPGIAQIFMNYGLIYCIFFMDSNIEKKEKKWFYIFTLGSILTFSLTGYIILLSIFIFKLYKEKKYTTLFLFIIIAITIGSFMIIQKLSTFSYSDRSEDYSFMISTIINNLPFGIGLGNTGELNRATDENFSKGFYCGLLYPLMQYGIFGFVYYWALYKSILYNSIEKDNKIVRRVFGIFILFTLFTEPQADEPLILCFIFDGIINYFTRVKELNYSLSHKRNLNNKIGAVRCNR